MLLAVTPPTELRKDRAERAPGGVTPGEEDYYASVVSERPAGLTPGNNAAGLPAYARPPAQQRSSSGLAVGPQQQQQPQRPSVPGSRPSGGPLTRGDSDSLDLCGDDNVEDLMLARDDLMDAILQDEEEIIALHRQQIEESMDIVRR